MCIFRYRKGSQRAANQFVLTALAQQSEDGMRGLLFPTVGGFASSGIDGSTRRLLLGAATRLACLAIACMVLDYAPNAKQQTTSSKPTFPTVAVFASSGFDESTLWLLLSAATELVCLAVACMVLGLGASIHYSNSLSASLRFLS